MASKKTRTPIKRIIRQRVGNLAKDWALGIAFPRAYKKAVSLPIDESKIVFLDLKSTRMPNAFSVMYPYVRDELGLNVSFVGLGQNDGVGWITYYRNCLALMSVIATARCVVLCDACDVISCLPLREGTKVVQLWHACGAFKKWGMSTAELKFGGTRKEVEKHPFYKNLSLVTVSSPEVEWAYREAMMLEDTPDVVQALGVSRTDVFFDPEFVSSARNSIVAKISAAKNKKIALYAPTFRGRTSEAKGPDALDLLAMKRELGDEWVLLIKNHPFVKTAPIIPEGCKDFAFEVFDTPIDELMCAADACITDYSSIVFEYSLLKRPIAFFAYDLDEYNDWRGFYYDYDEMTPGPVLKTTEEVINYLRNLENAFDSSEINEFCDKFMSSCDGHATERICMAILGN